MGTFYIDCVVFDPRNSSKSTTIKKMLVDTGSEYTWIPEDKLAQLNIEIKKKDVPFIMANGQKITRDIGYAVIRYKGFETIDEVVFGREGDLALLGARTVEGFAAVVDSRRKKMVAAGPLPVA